MKEAHNFFKNYKSGMISGLFTCTLARIERFDAKLMQADITPLHEPDASMILNCPVAAQQTGEFVMRFPYQPGNIVVVVFSQRDIEPILYGGGEQSKRYLDMDDAVIIGGINLFTEPLEGIPAEHDEDLVIAHKSFKSRIIMRKDGAIIADTDSNIYLGKDAEEGIPLGDQLKAWLDNHTHSYTWTDSGGSGETSVPKSPSPAPSEKVRIK